MLNKEEKIVMGVVYEACGENGTCLIRPLEILKNISYRNYFTPKSLENIMETLAVDEYFELIKSDNKGEMCYCVTLKSKGEAFKRSLTVMKRTIGFKVAIAIGSATVTFIFGLILKAIFSSI